MMPFMTIPFYLSMGLYDSIDYRHKAQEKTQERIKHYHDLYFSIKKRKDLRRCAKTRMMKEAESHWKMWKSIEVWEKDFYGTNIKKR